LLGIYLQFSSEILPRDGGARFEALSNDLQFSFEILQANKSANMADHCT